MSNLIKLTFVAIVATLIACPNCYGDLMHSTVRSPQQCPAGLTIKSQAVEGMIAFEVEVDSEAVANAGETYQGTGPYFGWRTPTWGLVGFFD